jgi:DNA excision repair protein ERCC-6
LLSGTPIQNNLIELWSLFDFVYPGRLGTREVFEQQFSIPIQLGGYANASTVQIQTSYKCAVILKDLISPFLLRRLKADVNADLPPKVEKVLFCLMTEYQKELYKCFLNSEEVTSIHRGKRNVLYGIDYLRKICNHPYLIETDEVVGNSLDLELQRSGKIKVLFSLLKLWKAQSHKVLVFCQTRQMLDIIEKLVLLYNRGAESYDYFRMDGNTAIEKRMSMIDRFNHDKDVFLFLLTTKVGGVGVNLTGANRVVIVDPDWNPSTDEQARERAWRLGQKNPVTVYRLISTGTIEEKIYHRQLFKQFLTNKILNDPTQTQFFKSTDLFDLFSYEEPREDGTTDTTDLLSSLSTEISSVLNRKKKRKRTGVEEEAVSGITGMEDYDADKGEKEKVSDPLLGELLDNVNIQAVIPHEEKHRPERVLIEAESSRISEEALKNLKKSREEQRKAKTAMKSVLEFGKSNKSGLKSSELIKAIKQKQTGTDDSVNQLMIDLYEFLESNGGRCSSETIVNHFRSRLKNNETILFRKMLKQIAEFKNKQWRLKRDDDV